MMTREEEKRREQATYDYIQLVKDSNTEPTLESYKTYVEILSKR